MADLFNETTIKRLVAESKIIPSVKQKKVAKKWIELLENNELEMEVANYPKFMRLILENLLGYDTIKMRHEEGNMEFPFRDSSGEYLVVFEAKGTKTKDLWGYQGRIEESKRTPDRQIFNYMINKIIPWGILTNYRYFVLFDRNKSPNEFYKFDFLDINNNPEKLKEFIKIFSRESLENNFVEKLKKASEVEEKELSGRFYKIYHETRLMMLKEFMENGRSKHESLHYTQLYLNRLMFVFFAEDLNFINKRLLEESIIRVLSSCSNNSSHVSDEILVLFEDLDKGSSKKEIQQFNGGLFKENLSRDAYFKDLRNTSFFKGIYSEKKKLNDRIKLDGDEMKIFNKVKKEGLNPIIENILLMASYDFKSELKVNVLGHIFEQSLSDLEELKEENISKRKKDGIFYTPEYITDYICRNTIIPYLSKSGTNDVDKLINEYSKDLEVLEEKFKNIKILDPACGSGAFLIKAIDVLFEIFEKIQKLKQSYGEYEAENFGKKRKKVAGQLTFKKFEEKDTIKEIIKNNIFGVDLNEESIETTKLSLFLRIAKKGKKLPDLSDNIKCGNSLIDDVEVAGDLAFDWNEEFKEIMDNGGFDVVIGNPPYVNIANISDKNVRSYYQSNYKTVKNKSDLYSIFTEKATRLLKESGLLSFIFSNSWLGTDSFSKFRKFLIEDTSVLKLVELPAGVFEDAIVTTIIIILSNSKPKKNKIELFKFSENKFNKMKHGLKYERIKKSESLTFSFEPEICFKADTLKLGEIVKFSLGIKTSNDKRFILDEKKDSDCYQILRGKDIQKYYCGISKKWIWYKPKLMMEKTGAGPRHLEYFLKSKIFIQDVAKSIIACYDTDNYLSTDTLSLIYEIDNEYDSKFILALLNSNFVNRWFKNNFPEGLHIKINQLKQIPIPTIHPPEQKPFIEKADLMLKLNKEFYEKKDKFLTMLKSDFGLEKVSKNLQKFYELDWKGFEDELNKKKIPLLGNKKDDWFDRFDRMSKEVRKLKDKINKTDEEIDRMVYDLYGLTKEEIEIVEGV